MSGGRAILQREKPRHTETRNLPKVTPVRVAGPGVSWYLGSTYQVSCRMLRLGLPLVSKIGAAHVLLELPVWWEKGTLLSQSTNQCRLQ